MIQEPEEEEDDDYRGNMSPQDSDISGPQLTEELVKALQDLENAASGDAAVRQKIASLPQEVQDVSLLEKDHWEALTEREKKLEEYKQKLARVTQVRKELKSHIQSLPDLSLLPNVTGGLAPLPSAWRPVLHRPLSFLLPVTPCLSPGHTLPVEPAH
ncbi:hypothetical protein J4Q44_G00214240 [Coregonus suidteri]|uniref:RPRD1A/B C-terminal domain-containing protein n=1 Tax=Coregonus suidteri TaxID=861788 RepID=A0AAN8LDH1_9TELE